MFLKALYSLVFAMVVFCAYQLVDSPKAGASLAGENGRILYIDTQNQTDINKIAETTNGQIEDSINQVITTSADGTGDVVAATSSNGVETATISKPEANGTSTIVYSEMANCQNSADFKSEQENGVIENPCTGDNPYELSQVSVSKVTIDKSGNPITSPENVVTFDPLFIGVPTYNSISELSMSPDGKNVLVTRISSPTDYTQSLWYGATPNTDTLGGDKESPLELGLKFKSDIDGYISGASIFVPSCTLVSQDGCGNDYVSYNVNLWDKKGNILATNTNYMVQPSTDGSGFWTAPILFDEPVAIKADKTYVISYSPSDNRYAATNGYFSSKYTNGTLIALKSRSDNGNGVYVYSPNSFPTETFEASNYWIDPIFRLYPLTTIENVNIETGEVTTIVAPRIDRLVAGGYAQNGNIYFSRTNSKNGSINDNQSNIWVIAKGQTEAVKLTHSPNISEFYIDAAPDNSVLLVASVSMGGPLNKGAVTSCYYPQAKYHHYTNCDYFYISAVDGSREKLKKLAKGFVPVFFSPDGNYLIGTLYPERYWGGARLSDCDCTEEMPVTAVVARNNLKVAIEISKNRGVQEWAPKNEIATTTVTSSTAPEQATLAYTGINSLYVLLISIVTIIGSLALLRSKKQL
jgi:hypothetical protein